MRHSRQLPRFTNHHHNNNGLVRVCSRDDALSSTTNECVISFFLVKCDVVKTSPGSCIVNKYTLRRTHTHTPDAHNSPQRATLSLWLLWPLRSGFFSLRGVFGADVTQLYRIHKTIAKDCIHIASFLLFFSTPLEIYFTVIGPDDKTGRGCVCACVLVLFLNAP